MSCAMNEWMKKVLDTYFKLDDQTNEVLQIFLYRFILNVYINYFISVLFDMHICVKQQY